MDWLNWQVVAASATAITVAAATLAGLPKIWSAIKGFFRFLVGLESVKDVPGLVVEGREINDKLDNVVTSVANISINVSKLSRDLKKHMEEEERLRKQEKNLVESLVEAVESQAEESDRQVVEMAEAVFRQAVFADPVAYYIVDWVVDDSPEGGQWVWKWGNPAYLNLTGLTVQQAKGGQYWDIIRPDQKDRVFAAATYSGDNGLPLEVDFINVNVATGEHTPVRVIAAPLKNRAEDTVGYLGSIHVRAVIEGEDD